MRLLARSLSFQRRYHGALFVRPLESLRLSNSVRHPRTANCRGTWSRRQWNPVHVLTRRTPRRRHTEVTSRPASAVHLLREGIEIKALGYTEAGAV